MHPLPRAMLGAALGGLPVLLAFFVWHWYRIAPVWNVLWEGLVFVAVVGAAVGWAFHEARGRFAPGLRGGLAFGALLASPLLAYEVGGLLFGPIPVPTTAAGNAARLAGELLALPLGALAGWWLLRSWRGAVAFALAFAALHVLLGGPILKRGGVGIAAEVFLVLVPVEVLAGVILAGVDARLGRG